MKEYGINQVLGLKNKFMYKYVLKNMTGEIINTTKQNSFKLGIEYFSKVKQLPKEVLFKIYKIEKV
jgi:hypothetical protein